MPSRVDAAVVGAGSAGAAAALLLARRGMRVVCLEAGPLDRAGARWVNVVPAHFFTAADIPAPSGAELAGRLAGHRLYALQGPEHIAVSFRDLLEVDMRRLVARLQAGAAAAGARVLGDVRVTGWDGHRLRCELGELEPRWVVDASGLGGARLLGQPAVPAGALCHAAQEVRAVGDPRAARAFFSRHGVGPDEVLSFAMVQGGFSTMTLGMSGRAGERVSLLAGTIPADGFEPGEVLLARFVAEHPWIGPRIFGGSRQIPLRRPYDRIAGGRVALLGDAACQVFAAHGSGTGLGLVAARLLADSLAAGRGVAGYGVDFQRRFGGLLAAADRVRGFLQRMPTGHLGRLMTAGLVNEGLAGIGVHQRVVLPEPRGLLGFCRGIAREPTYAARLMSIAATSGLLMAHYAAYPKDQGRLRRWTRRLAWLERRQGMETAPRPRGES